MRPLVLLSGPAKSWADRLLWATVIEAIVLSVFFFGHVQRGLCADVPGLCPPFPLQSMLLALPILFHLLSVVGGFFLAYGANSSYNKAMVLLGWVTIGADVSVVLLRLLLPSTEDADFAIFANIVVFFLLATAVTKIVCLSANFRWLRRWEVRGLKLMRVALGSRFLRDYLAELERPLAFSRDWIYSLILYSLAMAAIYGLGMLIFLMIPGGGTVFSSRVFFLLMILALPLLYSWLIYLAIVGLPDYKAQVEEFGIIQLSIPVLRGGLLLSVIHVVMGTTALVFHLWAAIANTTDTNVVVIVYAYVLAGVSILNLATYIMAAASISWYMTETQDFLTDIPRKLQYKTPRFPLLIPEDGASEVTTGVKDPYANVDTRELLRETQWTGPSAAPSMGMEQNYRETYDIPDSGPDDDNNTLSLPPQGGMVVGVNSVPPSMRRRVTQEGGGAPQRLMVTGEDEVPEYDL